MQERTLNNKEMKGWGKGSLQQKPVASANYKHTAEACQDVVVQSICCLPMEWEHHLEQPSNRHVLKEKGNESFTGPYTILYQTYTTCCLFYLPFSPNVLKANNYYKKCSS